MRYNIDMDSNHLDNLIETAEILFDPEMMQQITDSQRDIKEGRIYSQEEIENDS